MMTRPVTWIAVGIAAFLLLISSERDGNAQDKKEKSNEVVTFGGSSSRNMVNLVEKNIVEDFAIQRNTPKVAEKNLKWSARLGSYAYGGPIFAGGKIIVGTNNDSPRNPKIEGDKGVVMCFDEKTGKFLWQIVHDKADEVNDSARQGVISTPTVEGDRLYYVSNEGKLVCADTNGKIQWTYDIVKELDVFVGQSPSSATLIGGDLVYALTGNGVDAGTGKLPKPKAPALVAVNKKTGKLAWSNSLPGDKVMRGQWSNPTAATVNGKTQVIYAGGDGWLYSLDAKTGDLIWKFDCNPKKYGPYKYGGSSERSFIIATPVVHDNKCYIAVGQEPDEGPGVGHLWCIDITKKPANKEKDLSPVKDNFDPKAAVNKGSGLVWHYGGKVEPKPKDDEREFHFERTMGTVAVHDGVVYASELAGYMQAIDAKTGKRLWMHDFQESTWCSPYYVDGKVYLGTDTGNLYVFQAGRKHTQPKKISFGRPLKVPPVACNGVLYVNTGAYLYAFGKK